MKRLFVIILAIFLIGNAPPAFKSQYIIPGGAITVCTSDIDNDQYLDIITGHKVAWGDTNKSISILENIDNGIFSVKDTSKSFCGNQKNIFTINVNNDDFPDLVVFFSDHTYGTQRYIRVYYNEQGNFNNYTDFNLESNATFSGISHGKINNDEFDDIVVISNNGHFWGILYNDGNGGFTSPQYYDLSGPPFSIACGDLNGDGYDDVVIGGNILEVYYSNDTGFVQDSIGYQQFDVKIADLDNDGDKDLACLTDLISYTLVTLIENKGDGYFVKHESVLYSPLYWRFVLSDLNNDSLPDLVTASVNNGVYLLYNEGNFQLSDPVFIQVPLVGYDFVNVCSADLDKNGFNDLIITQTNAHFINILFNDGNGNFIENPITYVENTGQKTQNPILCFPNPFKNETIIKLNIEENEIAELLVYSFFGSKVKELTNKITKGGICTIKWDGLDDVGKPCKPGTYLLTLKVNKKVLQTIKLIKY